MTEIKSTALFYKQGNSDKEYHAFVIQVGTERYLVNFAYGRRGSALTTGTKTTSPVALDKAERIYEKLVNSKLAKGYTPSEDGRSFAMTEDAGRVSGLLPQLLNPVDEENCTGLLQNEEYGMQEKKDGRRTMVQVVNGKVTGVNRKGLVISLPTEIETSLRGCRDCVLDGELVGTNYHTFDALELGGELRFSGYEARFKQLKRLRTGKNVKFVPLFTGTLAKRRAFEMFRAGNKEGVVFKRLSAPYTVGRPNSGGSQLKYKFYETCSAEVSYHNMQRSVGLTVQGTNVGNVTIPPNKDIPPVGAIVEVRYLYYNEGGSLYQPVYLGIRDDLTASDRLSLLKRPE